VAVSAAATAYWASSGRRVTVAPPPVTPLEPAVTARVERGEASQSSGSREDFALDFAEQRLYQDGRTVATGLTVRVANRGGRSFVITGKEGTVGREQSSVVLNGNVVVTASDGLVAKTETASYADGEGIVRAPGPVAFERGATHGTGVGFAYDKHRDTMTVLDQTTAHVAGAGADGDMDITAGAFSEARRERYLRLEREAVVKRPGQTLAADEMMVYLLPDRDEPDSMELRGRASITGGAGFGTLRAMQAHDINVDYADDGRRVEHVTLAGQASITLASSAPDGPGQRLAAEWIDVALAPDGNVARIVGRDQLVVTLPGDGPTPTRTIRGAELMGDGGAGGGLTTMRFTGGVEFREGGSGGAEPPARTGRAETLSLGLGPGGIAERATFTGTTRFEDGTLVAVAPEARYALTADVLQLVGRPGAPAPYVTDTGLRVDADAIDIDLATNGLTATGRVTSVLQPAAARQGGGTARTPALLAADQPVYATGNRLEYDSQTRRATYTGKARLWQGGTDIKAERVVLDEQRGDLLAAGGVTSNLALQASGGGTPARGTVGRGQDLRYEDATRTATYSTNAQVSGPEGDLTAQRIALVLAAETRALARIEGDGEVVARVAEREGRGGHLTYHADEERYVMTGTPVRFTEECRITTGRTLTFFGTAGKLIVDGNEAARTVTKGGGRCPEPPR
jgi:LPS export ABC transporter protein LptC/lipopolysaccharide transport protein LptA